MENKRNFANRFDWTLAFILFTFLIISLLAIASAQTSGQYGINYVPKQIQWYVIGVIIISIVMFFEPEQYKKMSWYMYGAGIALLVLLIFMPEGPNQIGQPVNGAKSWYHTPIGNIQPSEFMKTFYILALARLISKHHEIHPLRSLKTDFLLLGKIAVTLIIPLAIIFA